MTPWYMRFYARLPELPGWFLPILVFAMLFACGFVFGGIWCAQRHVQAALTRSEPTATLVSATIESRLQFLEERIRRLERGAP